MMENFNFDKAIEEIKAKRNAETLSDEAKAKMIKALEEVEAKKFEEKKIHKFNYSFSQKVAAIFICCFVISSCAFAGDIGDIITKVFSNQDKNIEFAVENGYVQNIEMDYVESNGISLKADYFYLDDYYMYIAFDVKADREFNEVQLNEFEIKDENDNVIYSNVEIYGDVLLQSETKKMTNKSGIMLLKLSKFRENFFSYSKLIVTIRNIEIKDIDNFYEVAGNWNISLPVENNNIELEESEYYLTSEQLVDNYKIEFKNNNLKIVLNFNDDYMKNFNISKSNLYLEDENGNIYEIGEGSNIKENKLIVNFPINSYDKINNLILKIKYSNDEILVFHLIKADS